MIFYQQQQQQQGSKKALPTLRGYNDRDLRRIARLQSVSFDARWLQSLQRWNFVCRNQLYCWSSSNICKATIIIDLRVDCLNHNNKKAPQLGIFKIFTYKTNRFDKSCQAVKSCQKTVIKLPGTSNSTNVRWCVNQIIIYKAGKWWKDLLMIVSLSSPYRSAIFPKLVLC